MRVLVRYDATRSRIAVTEAGVPAADKSLVRRLEAKRAPSRAAPFSFCLTLNASLKSKIPTTTTIKSGRHTANSTICEAAMSASRKCDRNRIRPNARTNSLLWLLQGVVRATLEVGLRPVVVDAQPAAHVDVLQPRPEAVEFHIHPGGFGQSVLHLADVRHLRPH